MRRWRLRFVLLLLVVAAISGYAQNDSAQSQNSISSFFDSVAKATYNLAWPTATYDHWSFASLPKDVPGGYDVVVLLDGESGIDGSDLWLKLGVALRSNGIDHVWVVDHNAFWVPPFKTSQAIGQLTADLAKSYAQSQNQPTPAAPVQQAAPAPTAPVQQPAAPPPPSRGLAVCVSNATGMAMSFTYHWAGEDWSQDTLQPTAARIYWFPMDAGASAGPRYYIAYDNSVRPGVTVQNYELERYLVTLPTTCLAAKQYIFTTSGTDILLHSVN